MPTISPDRVVIAKLILQLVEIVSKRILNDDNYGSRAVDVLIICGVSVGDYEGKPMSALKLAQYTCIPRPTVIRRAKQLVIDRVVIQSERGKYSLAPEIKLNAGISTPSLTVAAILAAAGKLSKVDSRGIATPKLPK